MKEYDEITLKKVQQSELEILKDFIQICDDHQLNYFGLAGTGIGALRHNGFIPWDDDIDVGMLRSDYDKLIEIIKRDYREKYIVVNGEEYHSYPLMTTRIVRKGTIFIEESLKGIKNCPLGIFLDLYAFDNVAQDERKAKKQAFLTWLLSKILIMKFVPFPVLPFKGLAGKIFHIATAFSYGVLNILPISQEYLYGKAKKLSTAYNHQDCDAYAYFCDTDKYSNYFKKDDLFPIRKIKFEDIDFCFPRNIEKSLEYCFGDYMQLPPVEKRKNHFPYRLKFLNEKEIINE